VGSFLNRFHLNPGRQSEAKKRWEYRGGGVGHGKDFAFCVPRGKENKDDLLRGLFEPFASGGLASCPGGGTEKCDGLAARSRQIYRFFQLFDLLDNLPSVFLTRPVVRC